MPNITSYNPFGHTKLAVSDYKKVILSMRIFLRSLGINKSQAKMTMLAGLVRKDTQFPLPKPK